MTGRRRTAATILVAAMLAFLVAPASAASASESTPDGDIAPLGHGWCSTSVHYQNRIVLPATSSGSTHCVVSEGASGPAVTALQRSLRLCYYHDDTRIEVDGRWGPKTTKALKRAQQIENITQDGVYGPQTRNAIWHAPFIYIYFNCGRF